MASASPSSSPKTFWEALTDRTTIVRAAKVSALVGTLLIAINQGDILLSGNWPPFWKIALTYFVPYSVSSYSAAANMVEQAPKPRS